MGWISKRLKKPLFFRGLAPFLGQNGLKMAQKWPFLVIFEGAPLGAVGSTAPEPPAEFGARPTKQAAGPALVL